MRQEPIARTNLVDQAYRTIKEMIVAGRLAPGSQLKIEGLSGRLGVSSSPIREALRRLEQERWVEVIPCRGAFVRVLTEGEIREVYELRAILETAALCKTMPSVPAEGIAALADCVDRIEASLHAGDVSGYLSADMAFHCALVGLAGNGRLSAMFTTLVEQGTCFMLGHTLEAMRRVRGGKDDHAELLAAIRAGEVREALSMLQRHLSISDDEIQRFVEKGEGPSA